MILKRRAETRSHETVSDWIRSHVKGERGRSCWCQMKLRLSGICFFKENECTRRHVSVTSMSRQGNRSVTRDAWKGITWHGRGYRYYGDHTSHAATGRRTHTECCMWMKHCSVVAYHQLPVERLQRSQLLFFEWRRIKNSPSVMSWAKNTVEVSTAEMLCVFGWFGILGIASHSYSCIRSLLHAATRQRAAADEYGCPSLQETPLLHEEWWILILKEAVFGLKTKNVRNCSPHKIRFIPPFSRIHLCFDSSVHVFTSLSLFPKAASCSPRVSSMWKYLVFNYLDGSLIDTLQNKTLEFYTVLYSNALSLMLISADMTFPMAFEAKALYLQKKPVLYVTLH